MFLRILNTLYIDLTINSSSVFTYYKIIKMRCGRLMNTEFTSGFCFTVHYTPVTYPDNYKFTGNQEYFKI